MYGETQKENDLFFTCSLIEYIARKTKNTKKYIVEKLGEKNIRKIYDLAEVYHSENIEKISDVLRKSRLYILLLHAGKSVITIVAESWENSVECFLTSKIDIMQRIIYNIIILSYVQGAIKCTSYKTLAIVTTMEVLYASYSRT